MTTILLNNDTGEWVDRQIIFIHGMGTSTEISL